MRGRFPFDRNKGLQPVGDQIVRDGNDRALADRGMAVHRRFDFAEFDAIAAALDLIVTAAEKLELAVAVGIDEIYSADVEVFAPCALGGVINDDTVGRLRAKVVAGAANNQLATPLHGIRLHEMGVVYAPDFLVNAGGMLSVGGPIFGENDPGLIPGRLAGLYDATKDLLARAAERGVAPSEVALHLAKERIAAAG